MQKDQTFSIEEKTMFLKHTKQVNLSELLILGLLSYKELSGYEIYKIFEKKSEITDPILKLNKATVYNLLRAMGKEGFVNIKERIEDSNKPPKLIYSISELGIEHLREILLDSSENPVNAYVNIYVDLFFYKIFEKEEIKKIIHHKISQNNALIQILKIYVKTWPNNIVGVMSESQIKIYENISETLNKILVLVEEKSLEEIFSFKELNEKELSEKLNHYSTE
ncbi:MAG: PadR family transcriptional regulator [Candidatus Methanofastidiosa archaeon]|jgi:DNA-binding PadR family transcriptional regulator|nr:PadR family transcriptional regulator [Candidatus Methanofastidiosa archaeon]